MNGHCFTGAVELVLGCDLVVVASEAKLADTHVKFGLRPTWGMSQRLPRLVGVACPREAVLHLAHLHRHRGRRVGIALRAVPAAELDDAVA